MLEEFMQTKVGDIVTKNYLTAMIFTKYGIDFCCGGQRTIAQISKHKDIDLTKLKQELDYFFNTNTTITEDYANWPLNELILHIINKHHRYINEKSPIIQKYLAKLCQVHGNNHPELITINTIFNTICENLINHLAKEERILFPYLIQLADAIKNNKSLTKPMFESAARPIHVMMEEHTNEGVRINQIQELSNNYTPPTDACNTYKAAYAALFDFANDLYLHIHLENNILFKKSVIIEQQIQLI